MALWQREKNRFYNELIFHQKKKKKKRTLKLGLLSPFIQSTTPSALAESQEPSRAAWPRPVLWNQTPAPSPQPSGPRRLLQAASLKAVKGHCMVTL